MARFGVVTFCLLLAAGSGLALAHGDEHGAKAKTAVEAEQKPFGIAGDPTRVEFRNDGRGAMMGMVMPHAMHVHGLRFRVIERSVSSESK